MDVEIAIRLKEENKAFKVEKYVHSYPIAGAPTNPILYYPLIRGSLRSLRFGTACTNSIRKSTGNQGHRRRPFWKLVGQCERLEPSRSRYWGIPLPIWRTEDGKEAKCIGSVAELKGEMDKAVAAGVLDNLF